MRTFPTNIKLISLACLMITLPSGHCRKKITGLNCTMTAKKEKHGTIYTSSRNIPAINSCVEGYKNEDIISKCEHLINRESPSDLDLFSPVTNKVTNVTYWNKYCAICNNDTEKKWQLWLSWFYFREMEPFCKMMVPIIQRSEVYDLYELTKIFIDRTGVNLKAILYGDIELVCSLEGDWPIHLLHQIFPCLVHTFRVGQNKRFQQPCQYIDEAGKVCTKMHLFMNGLNYETANDEVMHHNQTMHKFNFNLGKYMVESGYEDIFYNCEKTRTIYAMEWNVKMIISIISLIFTLIYSYTNFNHLRSRNMTKKMLYWYMTGLLPMYGILSSIYSLYPVPCVAFYLAQFLWFFHFFWTLLIFIEFCWLAYCICYKCNANDDSCQKKRYIFYNIFGLFIPAVMPTIYFFGVLIANKNYQENAISVNALQILKQYTCPQVSGHTAVSCIPYQKSRAEYYSRILDDILSSSFNFFMPSLFLSALISALIYLAKCGSTGSRAISQRYHFIVLTKMALIMGFHWYLYKVYKQNGNDQSFTIFGSTLDAVCQASIDFHGVIAFIVFEIGNCIVKFKRKLESVSPQDTQITLQSRRLSAQRDSTQMNDYTLS